MSDRVWFITGASRGFGRVWADAALKRGDKVAATARVVSGVSDLVERYGDAVLPLTLDVTDVAQVKNAVAQAHAHFGKLDVVLNNAGYALVAAVEEASEADIRAEFDTNFMGAVRVIQAALPILRQQGSGHVIGVSSVAVSSRAPSPASITPRSGRSRRFTKAWRRRFARSASR